MNKIAQLVFQIRSLFYLEKQGVQEHCQKCVKVSQPYKS